MAEGFGLDADLISVIDVARQHGKRRSTVFKVLRRLGVEPVTLKSASSKNQLVAYVTPEECERVAVELRAMANREETADDDQPEDVATAEVGVFYLIQLEPQFDPGRFKVGFAVSLADRLRQLRCSAPFAAVVQSWPCRRLWERTAMDSVAAGCERLHTEVFRVASLGEVQARCERFFALMPAALASPQTPGQAPSQAAGE